MAWARLCIWWPETMRLATKACSVDTAVSEDGSPVPWTEPFWWDDEGVGRGAKMVTADAPLQLC